MLAAAKPEMISEHIDLLLKVGLGPRGKVSYSQITFWTCVSMIVCVQSDLVLAKYSCIALRRLGGNQKKIKGALSDTTVRLSMDNPVFERVKDIIEKTTDDQEWFSMAEQAINTIYVLGEQPDALAACILQDLSRRVFGAATASTDASGSKKSATPESQAVEDGAAQIQLEEPSGEEEVAEAGEKDEIAQPESSTAPSASPAPPGRQVADAFQLAQLLYTAGHISVRQLLHLELAEREFKRRKAELEKKDGSKAATTEELDQVVGSVEDDIADLVMHAKEKELLYSSDALLSLYGPMAVAICSQPKVYKVSQRVSAIMGLLLMSTTLCRTTPSGLRLFLLCASSCVSLRNSARIT